MVLEHACEPGGLMLRGRNEDLTSKSFKFLSRRDAIRGGVSKISPTEVLFWRIFQFERTIRLIGRLWG